MKNFKYNRDLLFGPKNYLTIDGERYYHFTAGGKWEATKWIVFEGVHYYNSQPILDEVDVDNQYTNEREIPTN